MTLKLSHRTAFAMNGRGMVQGGDTAFGLNGGLVLDGLKQQDCELYDLSGDTIDDVPPQQVYDIVEDALQKGRTGYTEAIGTPQIRQAIAGYYERQFGIGPGEDRVAAATGAAGAMTLALLCFFDPGDTIGIVLPGPEHYRQLSQVLGLQVVEIPVRAEAGWQPEISDLEGTCDKLDGLILCNPGNPAGGVMGDGALADMAAWCGQNGVQLLVDESGMGLNYDSAPITALTHGENIVVIGSFSRFFALPGWRLGWLVVPSDAVRKIECLAQSLTVSPPTLSQFAGVAALLQHDVLAARLTGLKSNRDLALQILQKMGFDHEGGGQGGTHLWLRLPDSLPDSAEFCAKLFQETGVLVRGGEAFAPDTGQRYIRLSYGMQPDRFARAIRKMANWLGETQ